MLPNHALFRESMASLADKIPVYSRSQTDEDCIANFIRSPVPTDSKVKVFTVFEPTGTGKTTREGREFSFKRSSDL